MPPRRNTAVNITQEELDRLLAENEALKAKRMDPAKMSTIVARHNPTIFTGEGEPHLLGDWCREFTNLFELIACPEELQVDQAAHYLRATAGEWWNRNKAEIRHVARDIEEGYVSWLEFQVILTDQFMPEFRKAKLREEFDTFKMTEDMTVETYHRKFRLLASYIDEFAKNETMLAMRFERGLTVDIKKRLTAAPPTTVQDIYLRAGAAERLSEQIKEDKKGKAEKRKSETVSDNTGAKKPNSGKFSGYSTNSAPGGMRNQSGGVSEVLVLEVMRPGSLVSGVGSRDTGSLSQVRRKPTGASRTPTSGLMGLGQRKANVVADALSRKSIHALSSARSRVRLHNELWEMGIHMIRRGEILGDLTVEPELYEEIRELQKADARIQKWRNIVEQAESGDDSRFVIHADGSLRFGGRWCVPDNEELKRKILTEAHATPYSVHPWGDKLYKNLKKTFWWPNMKREVL
ncbi:uncharacterized protein LOC141632934 [Silene latifolia]|uniref:uncharacterized protein LOC141632934 n=1 Tax=Silene latifolia TaxID=37657 RepID=UPI003D779351